jgi:Protein of unknown function (DUF3987)
MSWIDDILEATSQSECPPVYIRWAALSAIAATVRKRVWINRGGQYITYPTNFILLVGPSGAKKSFGVHVASKLVENIPEIWTMEGQTSIQALYEDLSTITTKKDGTVPVKKAEVYILGSEFSQMFVDDPNIYGSLLNLYDSNYKGRFEYRTKTSGKQVLNQPCFNFLAASAPVHITGQLSNRDRVGGFLARVIQITSSEPPKINSLVDDLPQIDFGKLSEYLKLVAKVEGGFSYSQHGKSYFKEWHDEFYQPSNLEELNDQTGFVNRAKDHILKTAMCLALANDPERLILDQDVIEEAVIWINSALAASKRSTIGGQETSSLSKLVRILFDEFLGSETHKIGKTRLIQKYVGQFSILDLEMAIDLMSKGGYLETTELVGKITYHGTDKLLKDWTIMKARIGQK